MARKRQLSVSVIIPAFNDAVGVLTCLNSLQSLQGAGDVSYYVQDDCSLNVLYSAVIPETIASVQRNERNLGFAGNCNAGAARATSDLLFFVNQDVWAVYGWSDNWLAKLITAFDDPSVGIVGARLLFPTGQVQSAGGTFDARSQPTHRCIGYGDPHYWEVEEARNVDWTTGAALAIRRELFEQLGGFDTAYQRGYFEDVDLCVRAQLAGYAVRYEPSVTFVHSVGSTGGSPNFAMNAGLFKKRWVDSGIVKPTETYVRERFW